MSQKISVGEHLGAKRQEAEAQRGGGGSTMNGRFAVPYSSY